jgi:hypothetical protein
MKLNKHNGRLFAFSSIALFVLSIFSLSFVKTFSYANNIPNDACNAEFSYTKDNDFDDSRIDIDITDFDGDDDRRVIIDPQTNYKLISIGIDYSGSDNNEVSPSVGDGFTTITYTAPNNESIDHVTVVVKKICASPTATATSSNITICHATGSQNNPYSQISVSPSAIDGNGNGNSDHNRSDHQNGEDIIPAGFWDQDGRNWNANGQAIWNNNCNIPTPTPTATATSVPTSTATSQPTSVPTESSQPSSTPSVDPSATPTGESTSTPEATVSATPNGDICANLDGIQLTMPDEYHHDNDKVNCLKFELGGPPPPSNTGGSQVLGASTTGTGKVLGASTMAGTGAVEDSIFYSLFSLGSLLTSFGIMKNGKKKN